MIRSARRALAAAAGALGVALLALVVGAAPVAAHAELVLASPAAGTGLPQAPARVVLKFSEPLNLQLSHLEVVDASGRDVAQGPTQAVPGDAAAMQRTLGPLPIGQYTVRWTTVSQIDGHTLHGSYAFGVGTTAEPAQTAASDALDSEGPLDLLGRFVALLGSSVWTGAAALWALGGRAGLDERRAVRLARWAPLVDALGKVVSVLAAALVATGSLAAVPGVFAGPAGSLTAVIIGAGLLAALLGPARRWAYLGLAAVAVVAEAASGHAAASPWPAAAVVAASVHLVAVGVWVWAIAASALASTALRSALATYSPWAIGAAVVTAASGVANAAAELTGPADLVDTGYGQALLLKGLAFVGMAVLGLVHHRRRGASGERPLGGPVRAELLAAVVALSVAAVLTGFPEPPRAAGDEPATGTDPVLTALTGDEAVSLAGASGPYVVGLTLLPGRPGPVSLRVQALGVEAGDAPRAVRVRATAAGHEQVVALDTTCGTGCFSAQTTLAGAGDWTFDLSLTTDRGPVSVRYTTPLPAPAGRQALAATQAAMDDLRTAHLVESLRGSATGPALVADYRFSAPDGMALEVQGSQRIILGERQWSRATAKDPWQASSFPAPGFSWPSGYYAAFWEGAQAIHVIGQATVDGIPCRIVAFVRPTLPAWFRLWVGVTDGLVHRQQMLAEGHVMEDAYDGFDTTAPVLPPLVPVSPSPSTSGG